MEENIQLEDSFLSNVGKEILIKSILQAIPTYTMGIFLLPRTIVDRLNSLIKKLWWGINGDNSKIHRLNWKSIGLDKSKGGLGM